MLQDELFGIGFFTALAYAMHKAKIEEERRIIPYYEGEGYRTLDRAMISAMMFGRKEELWFEDLHVELEGDQARVRDIERMRNSASEAGIIKHGERGIEGYRLNISPKHARRRIDHWEQEYPGITSYAQRVLENMRLLDEL